MTIAQAVSTHRLVDILHRVALQGQTGLLFIQNVAEQQADQGEIFFESGNTVFARVGEETGEVALSQMMSWKEARISFHEGVVICAERRQHIEPLPSSINSLLPIELQKTRLLRVMVSAPAATREPLSQTPRGEIPAMLPIRPAASSPVSSLWSVPARNILPDRSDGVQAETVIDTKIVYRVLPVVAARQIIQRLNRRERLVFLLLDGKRSVSEVSRLIHRSQEEVARALAHFLALGLIECVKV